MADTAVEITQGSGTNIDTRTEGTNGNHRQVVVIGDPATNAGVAPVDAANGLAVDVKASALPTGAATAANQTTLNGYVDGIETSLSSIDGKITACNTGAVAIASSALPTGAATSANQTTIVNAIDGVEGSLSSIDGKITACNTDSVTITASALPTGAATAAKQDTIIGHVDGIETLLGTIDADTSNLSTKIDSIDGKITACNTGAVTVAASALPTGAATAANQTTIAGYVDGIEASLTSVDSKITACNTGAVVLAAGTASIGKLAANSGVDIGDVDVTSLPALAAGTNLIGKASTAADTSTIYNGTTALTPKYAFANVAASQTDSNIVTAVGGKKIRVLSFRLHTAGTATNVTFNSKPAGAGTAITELFALAANGGRAEAYNPVGHFETVSGEGLTVTTGAGSTTGIGCVYVEV